MSDFISDYGEQLRLAGWQRLQRRGRLLRVLRARPTRRVAVVLVALVVAAPAVTATVVWRPLLGDGRTPAPTASTAPAAESQRAVLGVLRRPQTAADRGAQTRYALKFLGPSVAGVRTTEIRLLHVEPDGPGVVLIPVAEYGHEPADLPPELAALRRRPAGPNGLCLFSADADHGRPAGGGFGCYSTAQLMAGRATAGLGDRTYGLVPDGVDRIDVRLADGHVLASADVHDNFYIYSGHAGRGDLRWRDEQGKVLKTVPGESDQPIAPPDPATSLCDPKVPIDQCASGRYAGADPAPGRTP